MYAPSWENSAEFTLPWCVTTRKRSPRERLRVSADESQRSKIDSASGDNAADRSTPPLPAEPTESVSTHSPVAASQILTDRSLEAVITIWPSFEKSAELTGEAWPSNSCNKAPVWTFHNLAVPSCPLVASTRPFGEHAADVANGHVQARRRLPVLALRTCTAPDADMASTNLTGLASEDAATHARRSKPVPTLQRHSHVVVSHILMDWSSEIVTKECADWATATPQSLRLCPTNVCTCFPEVASQTSASFPAATATSGGRDSNRDTTLPSRSPAAASVRQSGRASWPKTRSPGKGPP
mmetsp:Transcript_15783/g.46852  ORF Transcript_15783/g.46852 Transcript_15783/m.46852 type:complete len:297 (+) Transcript_15783:181-1071(+)